jgi:hypothetical protein
MNGPLVLSALRRRLLGLGALDGIDSLDGSSSFGFWFFRSLEFRKWKNGGFVDHLFDCLFARHQHWRLGRLGGDECCRGDRLLSSRCRHFGVLVLVLGVTRGAASLLHLVFDHRDNRMVGNAALARTIVV